MMLQLCLGQRSMQMVPFELSYVIGQIWLSDYIKFEKQRKSLLVLIMPMLTIMKPKQFFFIY